jgi:16S rRNA (adenine1518-N6/adenine1519-N6)-dimethyltransferase
VTVTVTTNVRTLLRAYDLRPRKRLGQNFLVDPSALQRVVAAADLSFEDSVIEVVAGLGTLTRLLAERAGSVVAVEVDDRFVQILRGQLADLSNVQILHDDILRISAFEFPHLGYKVVANLPYYITSAVLRRFLGEEPRPRLMVVTLQREVAERIVAQPGEMSLLAVGVQFYGQPSIVARLPAGAFYPPPQVDSAVLRIDVGERPTVALADGCDDAIYFRVVRAGFSQRRKTLRNSLSGGLALAPGSVEEALGEAGLDPRRRAETLSLGEWAQATQALSSLLR